MLHQYLLNKLENISFSAKIFCESEIQSQNLNLVFNLCVAVSSKVCVFFSWFFKFHPSKSRNLKFRNQNKRVLLGIIFPAHTVEMKNIFIYKFSGGSLVSSLQAEIEQSTKTLTDLESETASARNQLTSLDAQKMKLVQEGNHK